jgi:protease II
MAAICPYQAALDRVPEQPAVLVTVAADDGRVPPWGPAKWVAALSAGRQQEAAGGQSAIVSDAAGLGVAAAPALLLPRQAGGHFGDEREHLADRSLEYAFVVAVCEQGDARSDSDRSSAVAIVTT